MALGVGGRDSVRPHESSRFTCNLEVWLALTSLKTPGPSLPPCARDFLMLLGNPGLTSYPPNPGSSSLRDRWEWREGKVNQRRRRGHSKLGLLTLLMG